MSDDQAKRLNEIKDKIMGESIPMRLEYIRELEMRLPTVYPELRDCLQAQIESKYPSPIEGRFTAELYGGPYDGELVIWPSGDEKAVTFDIDDQIDMYVRPDLCGKERSDAGQAEWMMLESKDREPGA